MATMVEWPHLQKPSFDVDAQCHSTDLLILEKDKHQRMSNMAKPVGSGCMYLLRQTLKGELA
jgi:hypothetical protein